MILVNCRCEPSNAQYDKVQVNIIKGKDQLSFYNILTNITFGFLLAEFGMTQTWIKQELDSLVWTYNGL